MATIKKFIETKRKLKVNEEKSKVAKADQVKFLGMTIVNSFIAISKKAINKAMEMVKSLIPRGTHHPIEQAIDRINTWYRGWASYFKMTQYPSQLAVIEAHIRRRMRARFVKQQKRRRNLFQKLIKRGVGRKLVAKTVYSNRGCWNLSHTRAVEKGYPNRWFEKGWLENCLQPRFKSLAPNRQVGEVSVKSRVRTRTHGSVGGRKPKGFLLPDKIYARKHYRQFLKI